MNLKANIQPEGRAGKTEAATASNDKVVCEHLGYCDSENNQQRIGHVEGISLENTDNCLNEFHYEELERARAVRGGGKHLPRETSGLRGYVCTVGEAEGLNKMCPESGALQGGTG